MQVVRLAELNVGRYQRAIWSCTRRIEITQLDKRTILTSECMCENRLVEESLRICCQEVDRVICTTIYIGLIHVSFRHTMDLEYWQWMTYSSIQGVCNSLLRRLSISMRHINVLDSVTIRSHPLMLISRAPVFSKKCLKQIFAGTAWYTINCIVATHNSSNIRIPGTLPEGWKIVLNQVLRRNNCVKRKSEAFVPVLQIIGSEMIASGDDLFNGGILASLWSKNRTVDV